MLKTSKIINRYGGFRVSQSRRKTKRWKIKLCYNSLRLKDIKVNLFIIINLWIYEYVSPRTRFSKLSNRINHLFLYFHNNNNRIETEEIGRKELIESLIITIVDRFTEVNISESDIESVDRSSSSVRSSHFHSLRGNFQRLI